MKDRIQQAVTDLNDDLVSISHWMYEHPETAYQETETSRQLVTFLQNQGFEVEFPAYGLDTAFAARAGSEGPEVVICCEMDALPGVGHACGHNIIAAAALGAGSALSQLVDELGFRLTVLGSPAEEAYGGKVDLIEAGALRDVTCAMMIHPAPDNLVDPEMLAITQRNVIYHGKAAHASAYPEQGINALDAFVQAYVNISTLRQSLRPSDRVHGVITHGGDAPNIIPDRTESVWYVRAETREELDAVVARVRACWEAAAVATGCTVEIKPRGHPYDELQNNPVLVDLYEQNSERIGRPMPRRVDRPHILKGSSDMGNVSRVVPSIHPMLAIDSGDAVNHQPEFAAATITPSGDRAIRDGALAMALTIYDLASDDRWSELSPLE